MTITREDLNPCTVQLNIVCAPEQVREGFSRAYKQAGKKLRIPGFRPGHAPRQVLEKAVGKQDLYELAADNIVRTTIKDALAAQTLEPFMTPSVELTKLEEDPAECEFVARVPLKPQVVLGDYKALKAQRPKIDITDAEVDRQIEDMRSRKGTRETIVDRGAQEGDVAVVNIKLEGETGDGRTFMTIVGQTFPELDALLAGTHAEDMKSADLTFPENFQEGDWAGKSHHCQVTVRSLSAVKLPQLDDTFAQEYDIANLSEMKGRMKEVILAAKQSQANQLVNEQLLSDLLESSTINVPDHMWEQVANQRLNDIAKEQQEKKKSFQAFAEEVGMTPEQLVEAVKNEAKLFVQRAQAIQEIFLKEELKLTNEDLTSELYEMARDFNMQPAEVLETLKRNNAMDELTHRTINAKVMNFLNAHATIEEVDADSPAPAPKATKAKAAAAEKAAPAEKKPAAKKRAPKAE